MLISMFKHVRVRSEYPVQSIMLHHTVYSYNTIPLMELLFMFTLFSNNTVIYMYFIQIPSLVFTWSMCLLNKQYCLIISYLDLLSYSGYISWYQNLQQGQCLFFIVFTAKTTLSQYFLTHKTEQQNKGNNIVVKTM